MICSVHAFKHRLSLSIHLRGVDVKSHLAEHVSQAIVQRGSARVILFRVQVSEAKICVLAFCAVEARSIFVRRIGFAIASPTTLMPCAVADCDAPQTLSVCHSQGRGFVPSSLLNECIS